MDAKIPDFVKPFFWDTDPSTLSLGEHRNFIIRRLLQAGSWEAITWLRGEIGDGELHLWLEQRHGAGLSPRQLRFWQLVLDLPSPQVTGWLQTALTRPWGRRLTR
jgi:hypothetical protein